MNYESGVMAEKGAPIAVELDRESAEFEGSARKKRRISIIAALLVLAVAIVAFFALRGAGTTTPRVTKMRRRRP